MRVLITGAAGFIGFHAAARLLREGHEVAGFDNLNDYYSPRLKEDRLARLSSGEAGGNFRFLKADLADAGAVARAFDEGRFSHVLHLGAQAGVRYSLQNPAAYVQSNLVGFFNILENCRRIGVEHLTFASSSSVYGLNTRLPFSEGDNVDHPVSLYAASKKSNELMAHSYSHLYGLPATGLRYFTVYGPWGRPDMAMYIFTRAIFAGEPIPVFNNGQMRRDFTYIDDIVSGTVAALGQPAAPNPDWDPQRPDPASSPAPWRILNIGNNTAVPLIDFIRILEKAVGKEARLNMLPMQPGDVPATYADVSRISGLFRPSTPLQTGVERYVRWYREYYGV